METIKQGSTGPIVGLAQDLLIKLNYDLVKDDDFGPKMSAAVFDFQKRNQLKMDRIIGDATWEKMAARVEAIDKSQKSGPVAQAPPQPSLPVTPLQSSPVTPLPVDPIQAAQPVQPPMVLVPGPRASNKPNIRVAPGKLLTLGLDLSHYQPSVTPAKVPANIRFVIAKASEGLATKDGSHDYHREWVLESGRKFGAYHFARPDFSVSAQAAFFLKVANPQPGDLLPTLDLETHGKTTAKAQIQWTLDFQDAVAQRIGKLPMLYLSPGFANDLGNPQEFFKFTNWMANYKVQAPAIPPPWNNWVFWQYAEQGAVAGINAGGVDHNYFNGPEEDLEKFCI